MQNQALQLAKAVADQFLQSLDSTPLHSTASVDELRSRFGDELPLDGKAPKDVITHLAKAVDGGLIGSASGRFFAWVIGGGLESALAADWLTATWDQNAALSVCSPAAAVAEEIVGRWLKDLLELPPESSFALTTGCQMAHLTCLTAARHAVLATTGWNVELKGLCGAPAVSVICNELRHGSIDKAVRLLGFGSESIHPVPTDIGGRIETGAFAEILNNTPGPKITVLSAGDINTGCFDRFEELIPIARRNDSWIHVDGAFGLFAKASGSRRHLVAGVEAADSWATDGHKWLNVPFDCGFAFVRSKDAHRTSMTTGGSYVSASSEIRDQIDWNPEWSRRARGFPVYAALLELGRNGVGELVDRCCELAIRLIDGLSVHPGTDVLWRPTLNQGLVRFLDSATDAIESDHDRMTDKMIAEINSTGEAFFSGTTWNGKRAMRVSVINWRTTELDIERTLSAIARTVSNTE